MLDFLLININYAQNKTSKNQSKNVLLKKYLHFLANHFKKNQFILFPTKN